MKRGQFLTLLGFLGVALTPAPVWAQVYNTQGDTYISQTNPTNNFGNIGTMTVGPLGSPGLGNAALVQVDISRLVALGVSASQIQQATFTVYVHTVGVAGGLDLATLMTPWSESTATYNAAPTPSGAIQSNVPVTGSNGYVTFDITSVLQGWLGSPTTNNGLQITAALAQPGTQVILDTKESTTTSHPAFIDVVLTATGTVGPTGPMGAAGPSGSVGPTGAAGPSGSVGATGAAGPSGSAGPTGAAGPSGSVGATGAAGPSGSVGPTGAAGPSGAVGVQRAVRQVRVVRWVRRGQRVRAVRWVQRARLDRVVRLVQRVRQVRVARWLRRGQRVRAVRWVQRARLDRVVRLARREPLVLAVQRVRRARLESSAEGSGPWPIRLWPPPWRLASHQPVWAHRQMRRPSSHFSPIHAVSR